MGSDNKIDKKEDNYYSDDGKQVTKGPTFRKKVHLLSLTMTILHQLL
jgi:hypothetical protein